VGDLEAKDYSVTLITCKISSLGHSLLVCHTDPSRNSVPKSAIHHIQCSSRDCYFYLFFNILLGSQETGSPGNQRSLEAR